MPFLVKLIITEAVFAVIGLATAAGSEAESKPGIIGSVVFLVSIIAFVVCGLWFIWSL